MDTFLRVDINIVAFVILGTILTLATKRLEKQDMLNKAYFRVVKIIMIQLLLETSTCIINRRDELWHIPITNILHICLFFIGAILTYQGYVLIHHLILPNQSISKRKKYFLWIPIIVNSIIVLLTPMLQLVFYIDQDNIYHRGNYFYISVIAIYFYLVLTLILIIQNRKNLSEHEFLLLITFSSMPIIGGILQAVFYGALLMWSSGAFALVVMYSYLQQRMVHLDYLTGVWSRGSFEFYIKNRYLQDNCDNLGIIYCDIDGLKEINDAYGHLEGDIAIRMATNIIKSSIRKTDIMVRMGGDEFIIVLECESFDILGTTLERIEKAFLQYNETSHKKYKLSCSFGSDILNSKYKSIEHFLHHVDSLMYENKKLKKEQNQK